MQSKTQQFVFLTACICEYTHNYMHCIINPTGMTHPKALFHCYAPAVGWLFVNLLNTFRRMRSVLPRVDVFADVIPLQVTHAALLLIDLYLYLVS